MSAGGKKGLKKMAAHVGPNMTPMVDIVMCILIFFMLSMTFAGAEIFLTSNMVVTDKGLGKKQDVVDMPKVKVTIEFRRNDKDGATEVRTDNSGGTFMRVGKTDTAKPENLAQEQEYNNVIYQQLRALHDGGMGDDALVILQPNGTIPYEDVIKVYDACVRARFAKVAFAPAG